MQQSVAINGRTLRLDISNAADAALAQRSSPLFLELELYFSCLVRKRVLVRESRATDSVRVSRSLEIAFRPVVTQRCAIAEVDQSDPPVQALPMTEPARFFPYWLTLDYARGDWIADFGYS